jgi:hypothetical protein
VVTAQVSKQFDAKNVVKSLRKAIPKRCFWRSIYRYAKKFIF